MYENKEDTNILLVLFTSIIYVFIAIFVIFFIGLSKVDASSYYFDAPRVHNFCATDIYGYCNTFARADTKYLDPGYGVGNYYNAIYRANSNINNVSGETFIAGNYSVSFSGSLRIIENTSLNTNLFKIRLIYYPNSSSEYAVATCDNNESFTIEKDNIQPRLYWYSYSCETLQITEGKTFLGWNIYLDLPSSNLVKYFEFAGITTNLTLIGEGEATNNDIINNQNQNTQDIINNANQNTQDIIDSVTNPDISGSNDTIGGFFGSFSDTDHGGLSGIITAPLIAFNQMLTGTCNDLSVEYKGSITTLPCGTSFWNQISPIRDFLNITLGGLICYQIVRKLFLLIQKIKNPDDDRVEVMSL